MLYLKYHYHGKTTSVYFYSGKMELNPNWQCGRALDDRMTYMLEQQLMCDVTFLVGPDQAPIKAHKYMLASASPVFYSMFEGPFAEKGEVIIPDIEREAFQDMLE